MPILLSFLTSFTFLSSFVTEFPDTLFPQPIFTFPLSVYTFLKFHVEFCPHFTTKMPYMLPNLILCPQLTHLINIYCALLTQKNSSSHSEYSSMERSKISWLQELTLK